MIAPHGGGDVVRLIPAPVIPIGTSYRGGGTRTPSTTDTADRDTYITALDDMVEACKRAMRCDCADLHALEVAMNGVERMIRSALEWEDVPA